LIVKVSVIQLYFVISLAKITPDLTPKIDFYKIFKTLKRGKIKNGRHE
jgi:hypothetical protein